MKRKIVDDLSPEFTYFQPVTLTNFQQVISMLVKDAKTERQGQKSRDVLPRLCSVLTM
ncbi:unnamed protein product [Anisakis simplex]|uniref:Uncharacterized protein n=1 Tax=Anisakis simplex TaxID=6269 RepID=A0A3P6NV97_ANISI|nr:unnamed protein product [Anisakis simplex]